MTTARWRPVTGVALGIGLASGVAVGFGGTTSAAMPSTLHAGQEVVRLSPDATIRLTRIDPTTVTPNRRLVIAGRVDTRNGAILRSAKLGVAVSSSPITARSAVPAALTDPPLLTPLPADSVALGSIGPGSPASFTIRLDPASLPLGRMGVYPIRLTLTSAGATSRRVETTLTTLLPWYPAPDQVAKTRLLFVWPLIDRQHRDSQGVFADDSLAASLRPGGRLNTLVNAATDQPVCWFIDPALLADASAMAAGYTVANPSPTVPPTAPPTAPSTVLPSDSATISPSGTRPTTSSTAGSVTPSTSSTAPDSRPGVKGANAAAAQLWLESLNAASARHEVAVVPYGDLDVASAIDAAHADLARAASNWGAAQASALLGRDVRSDVVWPVNGQMSEPTVDRLNRAGGSAVLLSGELAQPTVLPAYTPSGRTQVGQTGVDALLSDPVLNQLVQAGTTTDPVLATQRILGETLLITSELPAAGRLVVITPPRMFDPSPRYATDLLKGVSRAQWLKPVSLDRALRWPIPTIKRTQLPEVPPAGELPANYVDLAASSMARLRTFGAILTQPNPTVANYRAALYSGLSNQWRDNVAAGLAQLAGTTTALDGERARVRIVSRGGTLTSNSGPFPITVVNQLDQNVRLGLRVTSSDPLRLQIRAPRRVGVPSGARVSVDAQVDATTSGDLVAAAQIVTPRTRQEYSPPVVLAVHVRAYGQVAFLVFGGAAILLVIAAGILLYRRLRQARLATPPPSS